MSLSTSSHIFVTKTIHRIFGILCKDIVQMLKLIVHNYANTLNSTLLYYKDFLYKSFLFS